jgi:hypothetical protein
LGAALLLGTVLAVVAVAVPTASDPHHDRGHPHVVARPPERVVDARPARRVGAVTPERPVSVRLPDGTTVPVRAVGTRADGVLDVPEDVRSAGWWRGGSRIGDPLGSTLLAAHVDSTSQGLGPYASLLGVRRGQRVVLATATLRQEFRVTSLRLLPQGSLRGDEWISSPSGPRRVTLVTCAPPYDGSRGGYQRLAVVTAEPAGPPTRRRS